MGIFFSKKSTPSNNGDKKTEQPKKKQELSDTDKASLELKRARDRLRRQQDAAELCIKQEKDMAKELIAKGQKSKAILVLKRKAMKEKLLERARAQMLNVEQMIANIEEADNNLKVFERLKEGNTTLKDLQSQMSIDDINDILDDTAESIRVQEEISAALSQSLNTTEQSEIDAEVAAMMEMVDQGFDPFGDVTTEPKVAEPNYADMLPDAPKHVPKQQQQKKVQEKEEEEEEEREAVLA